LPTGDLDRMARAAHTLKSSSAAVGALAFSQMCADIEHVLRSLKVMPPTPQVEALIHEGARVQAAVGAMLSAK
jgi:HPt (histidine-containing phosphotransfer) domain-containing protein